MGLEAQNTFYMFHSIVVYRINLQQEPKARELRRSCKTVSCYKQLEEVVINDKYKGRTVTEQIDTDTDLSK